MFISKSFLTFRNSQYQNFINDDDVNHHGNVSSIMFLNVIKSHINS